MKPIHRVIFLIVLIAHGDAILAQDLYLEMTGKTNEETQVIDSLGYTKNFSDLNSLKSEISSMQTRLQSIGFISNQIVSTLKINDSTYRSNLSLKRRFYTIYIYYSKNDISEDLLNAIANEVTDTYFKVSISKTENILNYLNAKLIENGRPFTTLKLSEIKLRDDNNLQGTLIIDYDKERQIDRIVIKGYEKFPRSFLKHYLRIKKGDAFNLEDIKKKSEVLNALPFANQVRDPEVLFTKDSTDLYFYIEKVKSNTFDGFLGFGTNEETNKIEFDGYLNLNLINALNFGESLRLSYKSDEIDQQTFNVNLNLPYLLGSALGTELNLNIFKKDSTFTTASQTIDIFYQLDAAQRLYGGVNMQQSNNLLNTSIANDVMDFNSTFYTLKYDYLKRQNFNVLFPVNFRTHAKVGIGTRKFENQKIDQQVYGITVSKIFNLNEKNSIYLNGTSEGLLSDNYFTNELLRFGGINSIRGFEENSLFASLYGVVNTEYRLLLSPSIYIHTIIDAGYLDNDLVDEDEKLFGLGLGFGILTKAGLLKFNYANGKFEDEKFNLSNSKIHISLNATF